MPQVKAYRKSDGTLVRSHARTISAFRARTSAKGSLTHLRRTTTRFGQVKLDSLSVANIKRYGKPDAFGHKPTLLPTRKGRDFKAMKEHAYRAHEALSIMHGLPAGLSRDHYRQQFRSANRAKNIAKRGIF